jgi:hypothetical protein
MKSSFRWVSAVVSFALIFGLLFVTQNHKRAEIVSDPANKDKEVDGLVLKYRDGVVPFDIFGNQ